MSQSSPPDTVSKYRITSARKLGLGNSRTAVIFGFISLLLFGGILPRLIYLQISEGSRNQELAEENRIRLLPSPPERGKIFDRKGRLLARNEFQYSLFVWPRALNKKKWPRTEAILTRLLNVTSEELRSQISDSGQYRYLARVAKGLTFSQVVALAERRNDLVGIHISKEPIRVYPHGELAAHVLGYTGEINEVQLAKKQEQGYRLGDVIGQFGIESYYDDMLHGVWGGQQVEVNGSGQVVRI
ncbi:MAG: penicillin-binding protein 2, partial [Cyanobacteria bacterium P01_F01_bin.42]